VVVHFRDRSYANPQGLVAFVAEQASFAKVRPDMSVVFVRDLPSVPSRLKIATDVLRNLVKIAGRGKKAA